MIVVMRSGAERAQVDAVLTRIESARQPVHVFQGEERVVIALLGAEQSDELREALALMPGVEEVSATTRPYRLASREFHATPSRVRIGQTTLGGEFVIGAGAARMHTSDDLAGLAQQAEGAGANLFWVGRPRGADLAVVLPLIANLRQRTRLPILVDVWGPDEIDPLYTYADGLIVGPEHLHSYPLIRAVGRVHRPVVLCRGAATSIEEWLLVADQVLGAGNFQVVLCEQGIRTFETAVRSTLDFGAIAIVKRNSHLPIIANPSLACGSRDLAAALALGVAATGADGVLIDVHHGPSDEPSSGPQSIALADFRQVAMQLRSLTRAVAALPG